MEDAHIIPEEEQIAHIHRLMKIGISYAAYGNSLPDRNDWKKADHAISWHDNEGLLTVHYTNEELWKGVAQMMHSILMENMKNFAMKHSQTRVFENIEAKRMIVISDNFFSFLDVWKNNYWAEFVVSRSSYQDAEWKKNAHMFLNVQGMWNQLQNPKHGYFTKDAIFELIREKAEGMAHQGGTGSTFFCCKSCGKPVLGLQ
jgi:hypothetical protein